MVKQYKMVIAVRKDLDLGKGKIGSQVAHAAVSCALYAEKHDKKAFSEWMRQGQRKVVVRVDSLDEIYALKSRAESLGITHSLITDAGKTQVDPETVTCIGLGPAEEEVLDQLTGSFSLL